MSWDLTQEITQQREDAANTYAASCVIARLAESSDGQGGQVQAWTAIGTADCRLVANMGNARFVGSQFERTGDFTLTLAVDEDIAEHDRVTIDSTVYRVLFVDNVREWQTAQRAQLKEELE